VTFNGEGFDFKVLSAYGSVETLYRKSADMLARLSKQLGFRVKLDSVAQATLGRGKTGSGTECVAWWRSGDPAQRQKAVEYCKMDVELTRDIYLFAQQHGHLLIDDLRQNMRRRVEVTW
jgi:DEAD/DEAH box helicase domain-containing protein